MAEKKARKLKGKDEALVSRQVLQVPFNYSAGPIASKFLIALREEKKIFGIRCPKCKVVYLPPRGNCGKCLSALDEWVELSGAGRIRSFTRVNYQEPTHPSHPKQFIMAVIKLDGADTGLTHLVGEAREDELAVGTPVEPVFREYRKGNILDIKYFRPLKKGRG
jgi:uncharacterized protein